MYDMILASWQEFVPFYHNVRQTFWPFFFTGIGVIFTYGFLRMCFFYATARTISGWMDGSFLVYNVQKLYIKYLATDNERRKFEAGSEDQVFLNGGNLLGSFADILGWAIIGLIIIIMWPIIFSVLILFTPIKLTRNHFMRKKLFVAKLKGEEIDA